MISPHLSPERNGVTFGDVIVTIDKDCGDCVVHTTRKGPPGPVPISKRFHSIEEIEAAYRAQTHRGSSGEDLARAFKFAAQSLASGRKKRG
jgi:hypothetical protein